MTGRVFKTFGLGLVIGLLLCVTPGCDLWGIFGPSDGGGGGGGGGGDGDGDGSSGYCEPIGTPGSPIQGQMSAALNSYRLEHGLEALMYSDALEVAAEGHALDMYQRDFFDHTNPDGDGPLERVLRTDFCDLWMVGENIAWGLGELTTVDEVQQAWARSPGHNANMLNEDFAFVGVAHYLAPDGSHYWVQNFATPWN